MNQLASCEVRYSYSGNWLIVIRAILGPSNNETPVTENHQIITTCSTFGKLTGKIITTCSKLQVFPTCTIPCELWVFPRKIPIYIRGNTYNSQRILQVGNITAAVIGNTTSWFRYSDDWDVAVVSLPQDWCYSQPRFLAVVALQTSYKSVK